MIPARQRQSPKGNCAHAHRQQREEKGQSTRKDEDRIGADIRGERRIQLDGEGAIYQTHFVFKNGVAQPQMHVMHGREPRRAINSTISFVEQTKPAPGVILERHMAGGDRDRQAHANISGASGFPMVYPEICASATTTFSSCLKRVFRRQQFRSDLKRVFVWFIFKSDLKRCW